MATALLSVGATLGCGRGADATLEIIAPALDVSRLRFAVYPYSPVGDFALKRGSQFPFIDANGNGQYDGPNEVVGWCDRRAGAGRCWIGRTRVMLMRTTSDCPGNSGVLLVGGAFDEKGHRVESTLCDEKGTCSELRQNPFGDGADEDAMWIPEAPNMASSVLLTLRSGSDVLRNDQVAIPPALEIADGHVDLEKDLRVHVTVGNQIDLAHVVLRRGDEIRWSSTGHPEVFKAQGNQLDAVIPQAVLDACGDACEGYLSVAHVLRDDDVYSLSQARLKVL